MCKRNPAGRVQTVGSFSISEREFFMAVYFIEYDLRKSKDYSSLIKAIESLGGVRHLKSAWSIKHSNTTCELLAKHLHQYIDADDGLIVSQVLDWAHYKLEASPHNPKA
jgi:hypothetical protein